MELMATENSQKTAQSFQHEQELLNPNLLKTDAQKAIRSFLEKKGIYSEKLCEERIKNISPAIQGSIPFWKLHTMTAQTVIVYVNKKEPQMTNSSLNFSYIQKGEKHGNILFDGENFVQCN